MPDETHETVDLLDRAAKGDRIALGLLLTRHRERLHLALRLRIDARLRGRVDASDVLQEAYLEAAERFDEFVRDRPMSFFLWVRFLALQRLLKMHRHHLQTQRRDARREVRLATGPTPEASSADLAAHLLDRCATPSQEVVREEIKGRLQQALDQMEPTDREVLVLRHFEQLSNSETAEALGIRESAASQRYGRALRRLREVLAELPGGLSEVGM